MFAGILSLALLPLNSLAVAAERNSGKAQAAAGARVDFNRDIRSILSNNCYQCHGPDQEQRKGGSDGLRLDTARGATGDLGSYAAIVPGKPEESELIRRVRSDSEFEQMPPPGKGKKLSPAEIDVLERWIRQGAEYAEHWSYVQPTRPELPAVEQGAWPRNGIDHFILSRLEEEGLSPSAEADRYTLIRRLSLDLTGLPPTLDEVDAFINDPDPQAYEKLVDRLLDKNSFGEHWARMWLDLARYADSAGYADDPPRTIWAYRDYVIRSLNANKPLDQFTVEQIAGDLLPGATEEQLVATAFHRNTLTNNEGGTNDEEFRNVAIVDRVNTTMAVWMGTTIACAQCHSHKFDPITQEEFFRLFAFFNNTQDADRRDESPTIPVFTDEQKQNKAAWEKEIASLEEKLSTATPELLAAQAQWEESLRRPLDWKRLVPASWKSQAGSGIELLDDHSLRVAPGAKTDTYEVEYQLTPGQLSGLQPAESPGKILDELSPPQATLHALQLQVLADPELPGGGPGHAGGNFVLSRFTASLTPRDGQAPAGRYVRVEIPGKQKILSLAEVQTFRGSENLALHGTAKQSSTAYDGPAKLAIDGNTDGRYNEAKSTTHTAVSEDPWWEVDLGSEQPIDRIVLWNRTDNNLHTRLSDFRIRVLDADHQPVWEQTIAKPPHPSAAYSPSGVRTIDFAAAYADYTQDSFAPRQVLDNPDVKQHGWAIAGGAGRDRYLTLIPARPVEVKAGEILTVRLEQLSQYEGHTLGRFALAASGDRRAALLAELPADILALAQSPAGERSAAEKQRLTQYYLAEIAPALAAGRARLAQLKKHLSGMKPATTVPVMRELESKQRATLIQHRGNFLDTGAEVHEGVPAAFHPLPEQAAKNRLALARWLIDEENPLTARVMANRFWEQIFGVGLVRTSEEFGSQGELPSHPKLLDWLATELVRSDWNVKQFLKLLVTSATYRQSSEVSPALYRLDPDNRLLARGPRFRMTAEMIRDQSLQAGGLLSKKMYGPPVKPPQPKMGLSAAFGSGIDWKTSDGEDRYRRALYTTWRRSNPYPSMAAFDAPNREVCTVRRDRTNTPLQALVTLNDPVYIEAAQALARRVVKQADTTAARAELLFRRCLIRPPSSKELAKLTSLYESALARFQNDPEAALKMAAEPLGPLPAGGEPAALAAWTVVGNVVLNLDEMFMKP